MFSSRRWGNAGLWLAAFVLSNALIVVGGALPLKAAGIALIFSVLPGIAAASALFPRNRELDGWERLGLGYALGFFCSVQVIWLYMLVPGRLSLPVTLGLLDIQALVLGLLALWRQARVPAGPRVAWGARREALVGALLLAVSAVLLLAHLGYAEFDIDETPVVANAVAAILGNENAPYTLLKGPAQIIVTAVSTLLGGSVSEGFLRVPFALAALAGALLLWRLVRRLMGRAAGLAVLALWLAEGVHLEEGRWVQFQGIVTLAAIAAVLCFVHAARAGAGWRRFQWAGAFCLASGAFAHYDGAFVVPVAVLLWIWSERGSLRRRATWLNAGALAALGGLIAAPFYLSLFLHGDTAGHVDRYYIGLRVGRGLYNSIDDFAGRMMVLDSPAWLLATAAGLVFAGLFVGRGLWRHDRRRGALWFAAMACAVIAAAWPDALALAGANLSFVPYAVLAVVLALTPAAGLTARLVGMWAIGAGFFPAFWMQAPGNHYYPALPALTLAAVWGFTHASGVLTRIAPARWVRAAAAAAAIVACVTGALYLYMVLVASSPEYLNFGSDVPVRPLTLFARERPPALYGPYPHQAGWRAIAALYAQGTLRGEFESNEVASIADWYLSRVWNPPAARPRYYMRVVYPFAPLLGSDVPADLGDTHWLIGRVRVNGEARMLVYERRSAGSPPSVQDWSVEALDAEWQPLTALSRFVNYRDNGRDDSAFYAVARQLDAAGRPGDAVLLDDALGRALLARFYTRDLSLATSLSDPAVQHAQRIWGVYWASPERAVERELAGLTCPAGSQWFRNVRLALNGTGAYGPPAAVEATLGDAARLRSVALGDAVRGGILCVRLEWSPLRNTAERHKTFIHLVDANGRIVAQTDEEPLSGFKPTVSWGADAPFFSQVGLVVPAAAPSGKYRVEVGLYRESDGVRMHVTGASGITYANDAVQVGEIDLK